MNQRRAIPPMPGMKVQPRSLRRKSKSNAGSNRAEPSRIKQQKIETRIGQLLADLYVNRKITARKFMARNGLKSADLIHILMKHDVEPPSSMLRDTAKELEPDQVDDDGKSKVPKG